MSIGSDAQGGQNLPVMRSVSLRGRMRMHFAPWRGLHAEVFPGLRLKDLITMLRHIRGRKVAVKEPRHAGLKENLVKFVPLAMIPCRVHNSPVMHIFQKRKNRATRTVSARAERLKKMLLKKEGSVVSWDLEERAKYRSS